MPIDFILMPRKTIKKNFFIFLFFRRNSQKNAENNNILQLFQLKGGWKSMKRKKTLLSIVGVLVLSFTVVSGASATPIKECFWDECPPKPCYKAPCPMPTSIIPEME